jgi:hypothetical protein
VGGPALENGRPEVAQSVDRPSAEVGAEHHRPIVGRLGDDRYRPGDFSPGVIGQMRQKFDHGPVPDDAGGDGLDTSAAFGQCGLTLPDEAPQLPVASDLAGVRVVDDHLARPHVLQSAGISSVQRGEVLPDRISPSIGPSLPAYHLGSTGEFRKPRHPDPLFGLRILPRRPRRH